VAEPVAEPAFTMQPEKEGFISVDRNQSFIYMGYIFDRLQPIEMAYLRLVHDIMGNGAGCRLWFLRFKEKLAYSVYTQYATNKYSTMYRAAIGTDTSKTGQALESLNRELTKLIEEGITEDELAIAKAKMKNNLIYWIETKSGRATHMAGFEYYGYGYRFILDLINMADGVTLEQVNNFIKDKFNDDIKYVSVVGKM
jgi:zinc protease